MHKDQQRLQAAFLPALMDRILSEGDPVAERDCTVLNRLLLQGPDPLYLLETCPMEFADLCTSLGLDVGEGREAIERAHWEGPGTLLPEGEVTGLPSTLTTLPLIVPLAWRLEALWLMLASMSDCTEENYTAEITMLERVQRATRTATNLSRFILGTRPSLDAMMWKATAVLQRFERATPVRRDENGRPHTNVDYGFYVLYKAGHAVVAVHYNEETTFWGTVPSTSLAAHGIEVHTEISPQFGIVRDGPTWDSLPECADPLDFLKRG